MSPRGCRSAGLILTCFLVLGAVSAQAGDLYPPGTPGPTMKRLDQIDSSVTITSLPFTISSSGTYCLSSDLAGVAGQSGITVLASDVVIDGRGFTLRGVGSSLSGISVEGTLSNVTIRSITVDSWGQHGISSSSSKIRCADATCRKNGGAGFSVDSAELEDCVSSFNGAQGCVITGGGHVTVLKRCEFSSNASEGCYVSGHGHVTVLKACDSSNNGTDGLRCEESASLRCEDSSFSNNGGGGVVCRGGYLDKSSPLLLKSCVASSNTGSGFDFDCAKPLDRCTPQLSRCVSSGNGGDGLTVGNSFDGIESVTCEDSSFSSNTGNGVACLGGRIDKSTPLLMRACVADGNGGDGFAFSSGRAYDKSSPKLYERCSASSNTGNGVSFELSHTNLACVLSVADFSSEGNGLSGMRVHGGGGSGGSVVVCGDTSHFLTNGGPGVDFSLEADFDVADFGLSRCVSSQNTGSGVSVHAPASSSGTGSGGAVYLHQTRCDNNGSDGMTLVAMQIRCSSSSATQNAQHGFSLSGEDEDCDGTMDDCVSSRNAVHGVLAACSSLTVTACKSSRNSSSGFDLSASSSVCVSSSSSVSNGGSGITVHGLPTDDCDDGRVDRCVSSGNGADGISVSSSRCVIDSSSSSGNTGNGISVSSSTSGAVCGNFSSSNGDRGITVSSSHVEYRNNRCVSNPNGGLEVASGSDNLLRENFLSDNGVYGIALRSNDNRIYESSSTAQTNPLHEDGGLTNDVSSSGTAAASGPPNIGF